MTGNDAARAFLESITGYTDDPQGDPPSHDRPVKLGIVDLAYPGTGEPRVKFDGESVMGVRTYVALLPVVAGDRVVMLPVGRTYVVLGSVAGLILAAANIPNLPASKITSGTLPLARGGTGVAAANLTELKAALGIPYAETGGVTASSGSAGSGVSPVFWDGLTTIVLPVGMFSVAPNVRADVQAGSAVIWSSVSTVSASSFSVRLHRIGSQPGAGNLIDWTARQGTASGVTG